MSKISIVINQPAVNNSTLLTLMNFTQQPLSQINEHIANGTPVFDAALFYNDHSEISGNLSEIVTILQEAKVKFAIYELEEDEMFDKETHQLNEISVSTLKNILDPENQNE